MKKEHIAMIALVLIPLYLLTVVNIFRPVQAISVEENRTLRQKPAFSWQTLANGQFSRSYEEFFSDQFPFRQFFVKLNSSLVELMKKPFSGDISIVAGPDGDLELGEGERLEPDPEDKVVLPTQPQTPTQPATTPEPTLPAGTPTATVTQPAATATPSPVPSPLPTPTKPAGPVENISGVIIVGNQAMELFYYNEDRSQRYVDLINRLQAKMEKVQVYSLVAPTAIAYYAPEDYQNLADAQIRGISSIYSRMDSKIKTVDADSVLKTRVHEYLYFRTDHHWTARGAWCAYKAFADTAGFSAYPLEQFESGFVPGDFLGSLHRYTKSSKLKNNPDSVEYFLPRVESEGIAFSSSSMGEGYRIKAVRTEVDSTNKYLAFIQGDNPLVRLTTSVQNGKKIMVLKESFGNALVPFLLNHYEEVYVVDPRLLKADLPAFISQNGIQEVLIINYAFAVTNNKWVDGFAAMIG